MSKVAVQALSYTPTGTPAPVNRLATRLSGWGQSALPVTCHGASAAVEPSSLQTYVKDVVQGVAALIDYRRRQHIGEEETDDVRVVRCSPNLAALESSAFVPAPLQVRIAFPDLAGVLAAMMCEVEIPPHYPYALVSGDPPYSPAMRGSAEGTVSEQREEELETVDWDVRIENASLATYSSNT